jgi:hypothetical protein
MNYLYNHDTEIYHRHSRQLRAIIFRNLLPTFTRPGGLVRRPTCTIHYIVPSLLTHIFGAIDAHYRRRLTFLHSFYLGFSLYLHNITTPVFLALIAARTLSFYSSLGPGCSPRTLVDIWIVIVRLFLTLHDHRSLAFYRPSHYFMHTAALHTRSCTVLPLRLTRQTIVVYINTRVKRQSPH